jgi:tetratricopeptide (TPR) repeat protein
MNHLKNSTITRQLIQMIAPAVLLFSILLTPNIAVNAASNGTQSFGADEPDLIQGKELFIKARRMSYNAEASYDAVKDILNSSSKCFNKLPDGYQKYYWLAQTEFERGEIAESSGEKRQAAQSFTESGNLARKALSDNPKFSDANRLEADSIMRLMSYNGAMYTMSQFPKVIKLLNNAISFDAYNYTAMNSLGVYYINAPAIGGGSVPKGIQNLQKALESKDEFDDFIANVWLGKAYQKKKNNNEAVKYIKKALEIYPNSTWAKGLLKEIEKRQ